MLVSFSFPFSFFLAGGVKSIVELTYPQISYLKIHSTASTPNSTREPLWNGRKPWQQTPDLKPKIKINDIHTMLNIKTTQQSNNVNGGWGWNARIRCTRLK